MPESNRSPETSLRTGAGDRTADLDRIRRALAAAGALLAEYALRPLEVERKAGGDPVTEADRQADALLKETLLSPGEGWLSEETVDHPDRLERRRVWVVDPLDGTREFVTGIPEWCVSIGLVDDGRPVAGGVFNPGTGESVVGAMGLGVTLGGEPVAVLPTNSLRGGIVPASRSEVRRGEWDRFSEADFTVRPTGSVAYKLALVAAGLVTATWTLTPKNEWDVAAGCALVLAGGGAVVTPEGEVPEFNRPRTLLPGLIAAPPELCARLPAYLAREPGASTGEP